MFDLHDRVAIVTGGSRGIGRAISVTLGAAGAFVVVNYQGNQVAAEETLGLVKEAGGTGQICQFDIGKDDEARDAITAINKEKGRLDILVNNAGVARDNLLMRVKPAEVEETLRVNVAGAIYCCQAAIRPMMRSRFGRIINLSSVVAESGNPGQSVYSASKAAIIGLTKSLAREYASRGITVNAVAPGFIETDMTQGLPDEAKKHFIDQTPVGRIGSPADVSAAVLYLASQEASFVTGQVLRVNGGMYV